MYENLKKLIVEDAIRSAYGITESADYELFITSCVKRLETVTDAETKIIYVNLSSKCNDEDGNKQCTFSGRLVRRNQCAVFGGTMAWLENLNVFRGNFWSELEPLTDQQFFEQATQLFKQENYTGYMKISKFLRKSYAGDQSYKRMNQIATDSLNSFN